MIRQVLLLLVALNAGYLAFGWYRAQEAADPYRGVPPLELFRDAIELELLDSVLDPEPDPRPATPLSPEFPDSDSPAEETPPQRDLPVEDPDWGDPVGHEVVHLRHTCWAPFQCPFAESVLQVCT